MVNSELAKNDEIDLIDLIKILWKKKLVIFLSAVLFAVIAAIYAFTAKEQWTSKATVRAPLVSDLGTYFTLEREYADIIGDPEFTTEKLIERVFANFSVSLFSSDFKQQYFEQSDWYKKALSEYSSESSQQRFLANLLEKDLTVTKPDLKKDPNAIGINLIFSAQTPKDAQDVLKGYVEFVNQQVVDEQKSDFLEVLRQRIETLTLQKEQLAYSSEITRKIQLENLRNALEIAKTAGIKDYAKSVNGNMSLPEAMLGDAKIPFTDSKLSDGTYLFMLGEKYLQSQIAILNKAQIVYSPDYYKVEKQLSLLTPILKKAEKPMKSNSYHYLSSPDFPVQRDWPKRAILLIVGAVLGGIVGCAVVLVKFFLSSKE
ncbi:LPS O-antigen chain length determinant protein WzzB [Exercitatus varius]|uniref:LPS O-antigen chain length determinant protein WzzB n=1 Tax=Exercitatus varius TaxID=67857 RepID=UPI00294B79CC|nr:Wzz/FepE/Etk N-terminal domain-containing protein [Exercitatus varius]MDG2941715.1 Wzz/FepE/Etk N-terminal domain-containing protein [Exercitatus varius]